MSTFDNLNPEGNPPKFPEKENSMRNILRTTVYSVGIRVFLVLLYIFFEYAMPAMEGYVGSTRLRSV